MHIFLKFPPMVYIPICTKLKKNRTIVALFSFSSFPLHNSALCLNTSFLAYPISPLETENYTYTDIETELLDIGCAFVHNLLPQGKQLSSPISFSNNRATIIFPANHACMRSGFLFGMFPIPKILFNLLNNSSTCQRS